MVAFGVKRTWATASPRSSLTRLTLTRHNVGTIRETRLWNVPCGGQKSVRFRAREFNYSGPLLRFAREELGEVGGRAGGRGAPIPRARLIAWQEIRNGWKLRHDLRTRRGRYCKRAQLAGAYQFDRGRQVVERHMHRAGHEVGVAACR